MSKDKPESVPVTSATPAEVPAVDRGRSFVMPFKYFPPEICPDDASLLESLAYLAEGLPQRRLTLRDFRLYGHQIVVPVEMVRAVLGEEYAECVALIKEQQPDEGGAVSTEVVPTAALCRWLHVRNARHGYPITDSHLWTLRDFGEPLQWKRIRMVLGEEEQAAMVQDICDHRGYFSRLQLSFHNREEGVDAKEFAQWLELQNFRKGFRVADLTPEHCPALILVTEGIAFANMTLDYEGGSYGQRALCMDDFDHCPVDKWSPDPEVRTLRYVTWYSLNRVLGVEVEDLNKAMFMHVHHPEGYYAHDVAEWLEKRNRRKGF